MGVGDKTRSNGNIDGSMFQILYEFERRLDERMKDMRQQTREDIASAVSPVLLRLETIDERVREGNDRCNDRYDALEKRASDHSDRIDDVPALLAAHAGKVRALQPEDRSGARTAVTEKKKGMPWWLPLLAGGALAFVGERGMRMLINSLADPPAVTTQVHTP